MGICEAITVLGGSGTYGHEWRHYEPCKHPAKFRVWHFSDPANPQIVCGYHVRSSRKWNESRERIAKTLRQAPTSLNRIEAL